MEACKTEAKKETSDERDRETHVPIWVTEDSNTQGPSSLVRSERSQELGLKGSLPL